MSLRAKNGDLVINIAALVGPPSTGQPATAVLRLFGTYTPTVSLDSSFLSVEGPDIPDSLVATHSFIKIIGQQTFCTNRFSSAAQTPYLAGNGDDGEAVSWDTPATNSFNIAFVQFTRADIFDVDYWGEIP